MTRRTFLSAAFGMLAAPLLVSKAFRDPKLPEPVIDTSHPYDGSEHFASRASSCETLSMHALDKRFVWERAPFRISEEVWRDNCFTEDLFGRPIPYPA